ncbi:sensor histidine kinase [Knoellia subterranea]|uniref:Histidine kinase n=1 Tax=Knoellia subterranea KCTC 19937 TaxID=1385521 RepID=A0A0A0JP17_9MICO|nr:sensor histidine kinase [Knoellia subterranea]KGN37361.1 histidine kinase [Knoellia subterranea KCTC 19937]
MSENGIRHGLRPLPLADTTGLGRWVPWVPFIMLAVGSVTALGTAAVFGKDSPGWLTTQGVLVATAAIWSWWWTLRRPDWRSDRPRMAVHIVGRTLLAFALTWINPFFALFAWVGFLDVSEAFTGWARRVVVLGIAFTVAGSQSGGFPISTVWQAVIVVALVVVHSGIFLLFDRLEGEAKGRSEEQAATIVELERVNAELERALAENAELHERLVGQARLAGVHDERERLAREIHDTIAQTLAAALTQLQAAGSDADPDRRVQRVVRATDLVRDALADARRSVLDLAPAALDHAGLAAALEALVAQWDEEQGATASLVITGEPRDLHPEVEATVLRIAQEALANVAKHATAARVGVTLSYDDGELILDVRDDGSGFDPAAATGATSFGLRGMRQRAERLMGQLEIESRPRGGTALSLRLPALPREAVA